MTSIPDHLTQHGAVTLAGRIETYWRAKGFYVTTTVDYIGGGWKPIWVVRSDLVNGLPARKLA